MPINVLILYDRKGSAIAALAQAAVYGVEGTGLAKARLKALEDAQRSDLLESDAIMLGSPNWSGITGTDCIIGNVATLAGTFEGNLADVAVWNRILTSDDVSVLYKMGNRNSPPYRLVRAFSQLSPDNDTRVFTVGRTEHTYAVG